MWTSETDSFLCDAQKYTKKKSSTFYPGGWRKASRSPKSFLETLRFAAARRRLPMVEVNPTVQLIGPHGPVTPLGQSNS